MSPPLAYLITFTCYAQWLHGDRRGSVDRRQNGVDEEFLPRNDLQEEREHLNKDYTPYRLDEPRRIRVLAAIRETCGYRGWRLWALHVRATHVHVVVTGLATPEKIMTDLKAYASRALNRSGLDHIACKHWSRHGSTRYINAPKHLDAAIEYVLFKQGFPMAVFDGRNGVDGTNEASPTR